MDYSGTITIYPDAQVTPAWPGYPSLPQLPRADCCLLLTCIPIALEHLHALWHTRCSGSSHFPPALPGITCVSKETWVLSVKKGPQNQDLGARYVLCYWGLDGRRPSQWRELGEIQIYTQTKTHLHLYFSVHTLNVMGSLKPLVPIQRRRLIMASQVSICVTPSPRARHQL